jgi:RNA polymerase sigma-70 factor (ECF subfamily)
LAHSERIFENVASDHRALISRIARSYESDGGRREDLVQQIFIAIWQALPHFRDDASLKTFVARIAQNRAISHVARRVRDRESGILSDQMAGNDPSPEDEANHSSMRRLLVGATLALPLPQREVVVLLLEGFSYAEIAETLKLAPNAVALRCARAKAALQAQLETKV